MKVFSAVMLSPVSSLLVVSGDTLSPSTVTLTGVLLVTHFTVAVVWVAPCSTVAGVTLAMSVSALYRLSVPSSATSKSVPAFTVPACSAVATGTFPAISALSSSVST